MDILCMANSRKLSGHCVAGLRMDCGRWVRLAGMSREGALFDQQMRFQDGEMPQPLDLMRVDVYRPCPLPHQPENYIIDGTPWTLLYRPAPPTIIPMMKRSLDRGPDIFGDRERRIPYAKYQKSPASSSLTLIRPEICSWMIRTDNSGRQHIRCHFRLQEAEYQLPVTDPDTERLLQPLPDGEYPTEETGLPVKPHPIFTISLGEPFGDDSLCYKLIAAVIVPPNEWRQHQTCRNMVSV